MNMKRPPLLAPTLVLSALLLTSITAHAGRPLAVDDANINDAGKGHVEAWYAKGGEAKGFTLAPAYAINDHIELSTAIQRDLTNKDTLTTLQAKYRLNKARENGCHFASALAYTRASGDGLLGLTGMGTCDVGVANLNINLGLQRANGGLGTGKSWGLSLDKTLGGENGSSTAHIELFGAKGASRTIQLGLAHKLNQRWQWDGTVGRSAGFMLWSLGTKYSF